MKMGNSQAGHSNCCDSDDEPLDVSVLDDCNRGAGSARSSFLEDTNSMKTDAVGHRRAIRTYVPDEQFVEIIKEYDEDLDADEKISLIYLLYDNPINALKDMELVASGCVKNVLLDWYTSENCTTEACQKVFEALCVIQNYHILISHGHKKADLLAEFMPMQRRICSYLPLIKKGFYRMFEDMAPKDENNFLQLIRDDFRQQKRTFPSYTHFEMYFAYFAHCEYITTANIDNILKHLKVLEKDSLIVDLKAIVQGSQQDNLKPSPSYTQELRLNEAPLMIIDKTTPSQVEDVSNVFASKSSASVYKMNPKHPGVVLIIENVNFYTELVPNPERPPVTNERKIEDRTGSEFDSKRLIRLFEDGFGFKVVYHKDRTYEEMYDIINETVWNTVTEEHCSFFLVLLSHGLEGQVIACNSVPMYISDIKKMICSPQLEGKPKILILQFCQGEEVQTLATTSSISTKESDCIRTDGVGYSHVPPTADILELWSTVPGYGSFRSTSQGTWFIQALCDVLEKESSGEHLYNLCIALQERVVNKQWKFNLPGFEPEVRVMVPQTTSTFSKRFYFPPLKN